MALDLNRHVIEIIETLFKIITISVFGTWYR